MSEQDQAYAALVAEFEARARALGREIPNAGLQNPPPLRPTGAEAEVASDDPPNNTGMNVDNVGDVSAAARAFQQNAPQPHGNQWGVGGSGQNGGFWRDPR